MTDQPTPQATCPWCKHAAHHPGTECEAGVEHGPKRWHRCLCLNLVGADHACHPQMDCQGGTLGYSDVWHLQRRNAAIDTASDTAQHPTAFEDARDGRTALKVTSNGAARQATGQDDTACSLPGFAGCECNHLTGCEHPAPAVGQPAEAHDTALRERLRLAIAQQYLADTGSGRTIHELDDTEFGSLADAALRALAVEDER